MTKDELYKITFQLILHSGNARSSAMEGMSMAREGKLQQAEEKIEESSNELNEGHHIQTKLIQNEARGAKLDISLIMVHAQDHLMNAITIRDMAKEIIYLNKKLDS